VVVFCGCKLRNPLIPGVVVGFGWWVGVLCVGGVFSRRHETSRVRKEGLFLISKSSGGLFSSFGPEIGGGGGGGHIKDS